MRIDGDLPHRKMSRVGVYGVVGDGHKMQLIVQEKGPFAGRYDLPGGGIEFGETIEEALHREFREELGHDFASMTLLFNLSGQVEMPSYTFHQIGLIYSVSGLYPVSFEEKSLLKRDWVDVRILKKEECSLFLWDIICRNRQYFVY